MLEPELNLCNLVPLGEKFTESRFKLHCAYRMLLGSDEMAVLSLEWLSQIRPRNPKNGRSMCIYFHLTLEKRS